MGVAVVAVVTLGVFALIALSRWGSDDGEALLATRIIAAREIDGLQGTCADHLQELVGMAEDPGSPQRPECAGYPRGAWRQAVEPAVPGLRYQVTVRPAEAVAGPGGQETSYDLVEVEVVFRWPRAFAMEREGAARYRTYLFGDSTRYWEDFDEWRARCTRTACDR